MGSKAGKTPFMERASVRRIALAIAGVVVGLAVYMLNSEVVLKDKMPMPFGVGGAVVMSGSMEPSIHVGDLVLVGACDSCGVGDVVVYQDGGSLVVHRIVDDGSEGVITRGDANNVDDEPVASESIKGKVFLVVPYAGVLLNALRSPLGVLLEASALVVFAEFGYRKRGEKDDVAIEEMRGEIARLKGTTRSGGDGDAL